MQKVVVHAVFIVPLLLAPFTAAAQPKVVPGTVVPGRELVVSAKVVSGTLRSFDNRALRSAKLPAKLRALTSISTVGVLEVEAGNETSEAALRQQCQEVMEANPDLICEPNYVYSAFEVPNDPYYSSLWGMDRIQAPAAWDVRSGSPVVKVGILDSGIDYVHPELAANVSKSSYADFVDHDQDPMDWFSHGTHVAGIIGAVGNNAAGVAGVNWNVELVPIRVLDSQGNGSIESLSTGLDYAMSSKVSVVNVSLGGTGFSQILYNKFKALDDAGIVAVVAAGNGGGDARGDNNDSVPSYPGNFRFPRMIVVAATDSNDQLASFSNYGKNSVDVAAPGVHIASTVPLWTGNSPYQYKDGTSMATPHVTGVAALMLSVNPSLSASDIRRILLASVDKVSGLQGKVATGGRLNALKAVTAAMNGQPPPPQVQPTQPAGQVIPALHLAALRNNASSVTFYAVLYDVSNRVGLSDVPVDLLCNRRKVHTVTSKGGAVTFRSLRKDNKRKRCFARARQYRVSSNSVAMGRRGKLPVSATLRTS